MDSEKLMLLRRGIDGENNERKKPLLEALLNEAITSVQSLEAHVKELEDIKSPFPPVNTQAVLDANKRTVQALTRVVDLEAKQKRRPMDSFPSGTRLAEWAIPDGTSHGWYMTSWRGRTDRSDGCWFADTHNARHLLAQPIHWVELPDPSTEGKSNA